ncbi:MAG: hypothetical protein HYY03_08935 [Chloroflexi bacterium]|nr:hypothetical protein [Chloroflexota bacterium]
MQDRPTYDELLAAVERFLDSEILPNVEGSRRFHARVATNVIRIVRRELEREEEALAAEWAGLDALLGHVERPADRAALREAIRARNAGLCERIRRGDADSGPLRAQVLDHMRRTVQEKLRISDPDWLRRSQE